MALARVQYTQQVSGNKNFTVPFPYISRDHIFVSVNGGDVGFTWLNDTTVQITTAPAVGDVIDIRRETEKVNLLVDFQDASTITEEQLDLSAKQAFFIAQEAFDATGGTMAVANDGSYSANNRRISNLGDPDSDDDAANVRWVKQQYTDGKNAYQERLLAEAARDAADASKTAAATSEANALSYRNTANSHRLAAENAASAAAASQAASAASATAAANSAAAAKASEDDVAANAAAAASSEANALSYKNSAAASSSSASSNATSAANSSAKASQWAELPEDSAVEPGKYSAKHHAAKAAASSASAALSATTAAGYRDTANSHKNAAAASAAAAATSESNALSYRNTANSHRQAAAASAAEAAGYAAGLNLPSGQGNGGKLLRQKVDESGLEYTSGGAGSGINADLLDGKSRESFMESGYIPQSDFNKVTQSGVYRFNGAEGHQNMPWGVDWGQLLVLHGGGDTITQIVGDYSSNYLYWRSGNPSDVGGSGSWHGWKRISHDGYNGRPTLPAFYISNGRRTGSSNSTLIINGSTVQVNRGGHFNASNGRFTAPVSGIYYFDFWITKDNNGGATPRLDIVHNSTTVASGLSYYTDYSGAALSAVVEMAAGDYVFARVVGANNGAPNFYGAGFSGYQLG